MYLCRSPLDRSCWSYGYDQPVNTITADAWNEVVLNTPYTIPEATQLWLVIVCNATGGYPAVVMPDLKLRATAI